MFARTRGEGVKLVQTLCRQEGKEGQFLAILCGRLLWTAPYCIRSFRI